MNGATIVLNPFDGIGSVVVVEVVVEDVAVVVVLLVDADDVETSGSFEVVDVEEVVVKNSKFISGSGSLNCSFISFEYSKFCNSPNFPLRIISLVISSAVKLAH